MHHALSRFLLTACSLTLAAMVCLFLLPAPWRTEVTNDEMLHLESWRIRYRTADIDPLFRERLKRVPRLSSTLVRFLEQAYASSSLAQRASLLHAEAHPPLFPAMAETVEALTHSSLIAVRLLPLAFTLIMLVLALRIGCLLKDQWLGWWLASLLAASAGVQTYAGIARPHALGECALLWVLYSFLCDARRPPSSSPVRFLAALLLAQCTVWLVWPIVFPLLVFALARRYMAGSTLLSLLRSSWWYIASSAFLFLLLRVQLLNPALGSDMTTSPASVLLMPNIPRELKNLGLLTVWDNLSLVSPFAWVETLTHTNKDLGAAFLSGLAILGCYFTIRDRFAVGHARWALLGSLLVALVVPFFVFAQVRALLIPVLLPVFFAAMALRCCIPSPAWNGLACASVTTAALVTGLMYPSDPYIHFLRTDTNYGAIAQVLHEELTPEDQWTSYPYYISDCLYPYATLPEPERVLSPSELETLVASRPSNSRLFILYRSLPANLSQRDLPSGRYWTFRNGITLIEILPGQRSRSGTNPQANGPKGLLGHASQINRPAGGEAQAAFFP